MVLAKAGTRVVRLLKLVSAFCSIVRGWSRAPSRCVWVFHSATAREFLGEMGLPEGNMTDPTDPENHDQLGPLGLQLADAFGIMRQSIGRGKPAL